MKQFNLDEYLKNPNRKVVTGDGREARIICTDRLGAYPVIGLVRTDKVETVLFYTDTGRIYPEMLSGYDLFFDPERKEGWVNLYKSEEELYTGKVIYSTKKELYPGKEIYSTKEEAADIGKQLGDYITTAKIEWEE